MQKNRITVFIIIAITILIGQVIFAQGEISWKKCLELGNVNLKGIAYDGKGLFAVVGEDGRIKTSQGGIVWVGRESGTVESLNSITYGNGTFIAVGEGVITASVDGINWVPKSSLSLNSVVWHIDKFYAVGKFGTIISSPDGETWSKAEINSNETLNDIFSYSNKLAAVGDKGGFYLSSDGVNWTKTSISSDASIKNICWNGAKYVASADNGNIVTSMDGTSWAWVSLEASLGGKTNEVSGTSKGLLQLGSGIKDICWDGTRFIAVGFNGAIYTSDSGTKWTKISLSSSNNLESVIFTGSQYVIVGSNGTLLQSRDLDKWIPTNLNSNDQNLNSVVWGKNKFVIVGNSGIILTSYDGELWVKQDNTFGKDYNKVIYTGKTFVAVGTEGYIITSDDGIKWTRSNSGIFSKLNSIAWNGKIFVAVGEAGEILTSANCIKWNISNSGAYRSIDKIVWDGVNFVATEGKNGTILISSDGKIWSRVTHLKDGIVNNTFGDTLIFPDADNINKQIPEIKSIKHIIWNGTEYIGVGDLTASHVETRKNQVDTPIRLGNSTVTSKDGIKWTNETLGSVKNLSSVAWNGEVLVACGDEGTVLSAIPSYIKVDIDGRSLESDTPPIIRNGRTMVPLRPICEALGMTVDWNDATKTIKCTSEESTIILKLGSKEAVANGKAIKLDEPANVIRSRTMVPLRFVAENFGAKVSWDNAKKTVYITIDRTL
jgi:hypothetical protein